MKWLTGCRDWRVLLLLVLAEEKCTRSFGANNCCLLAGGLNLHHRATQLAESRK